MVNADGRNDRAGKDVLDPIRRAPQE